MAKDRPRIGRKLRRAMEQARLNQNDVADALGVSRGAVNAWLNDRAYPQNSIAALEELLGVDLEDDDEPVARSETPEQALDRLERELAHLRQVIADRDMGKAPDENGGRRAS